jgi:putative flippase GtrA
MVKVQAGTLKKIIAFFKSKNFIRFVKFCAVGMSGTVVDFGILTALKELAHMPTLPANVISFSTAMVNNFIWNYIWTFRDIRDKKVSVVFIQFAVISVIGLGLNSAIVVLLEHPLNFLFTRPNTGYLAAKFLATIAVLLWNFFANRFWTFRQKPVDANNPPTPSENI